MAASFLVLACTLFSFSLLPFINGYHAPNLQTNQPPLVVNVTSSEISIQTKIAVQACAGLLNRAANVTGGVYVIFNSRDSEWLNDLEGISKPNLTPIDKFLGEICLGSAGGESQVKGFLHYDFTSQHRISPLIFTMAGVLDAVPLEAGSPYIGNATMVLDAVALLSGLSPIKATSLVFDRFGNATSTLAFVNPGLDVHKNPIDPPLTGLPDTSLLDYIVKERLFAFYLVNACVPLTQAHKVMERMVKENPWPRPIAVFGYDDTYPLGGDLFEAETDCVKEHNMGEVATAGVSNLSFLSAKKPVTEPLKQNPFPPPSPFNHSKTYVSFVIGDGDNVAYLKGARRSWMLERVNACKADPSSCFSLLWSISPHIIHLAPDLLHWYYEQSFITGKDFFVLPPSGHLYAYPSEMEEKDQETFVRKTEEECRLLNTSATTAWEFGGTWEKAVKEYFPRYAEKSIIQAIFPVNVPFFLPILPLEGIPYLTFNKTVLFQPREWRGVSGSKNPVSHKFLLPVSEMAAEINGYPPGTVKAMYLTSDGGLTIDNLFEMVKLLDASHVEVVDHETLVRMVFAREEEAL